MTENDVKRTLLLWLSMQNHILAWNNPTGVARALQAPHPVISYGLPGSPDIVGVASLPCPSCGERVGRALGIEVKTPTGRQSEIQQRFQAEWMRRGGIYLVARGIEDLEVIK